MQYNELARNQDRDPRCLKKKGTRTSGGSVTISASGTKYKYEKPSDVGSAIVFVWDGYGGDVATLPVGTILYACLSGSKQHQIIAQTARNCENVVTGNYGGYVWGAWRVTSVNEHALTLNEGPFILHASAIYTPDDWNHVKALYDAGILDQPWFRATIRVSELEKRS